MVIVLAKSVIWERIKASSSRCRCLSELELAIEWDFIKDGGVDIDDLRFFK